MAIFIKSRSKKIWAYAFVLVAFFGVFAWGVAQATARARYRNMLDGMMQRSFYELVGGMSNVEVSLSKLMVSDQPDMITTILRDITKYSNGASSALSALPISQAQTASVVKLINQVGDYAQTASLRIADGTPLSADDQAMLEDLRARCNAISGELSRLTLDAGDLWNIDRDGYFAEVAPEDASPLESLDQTGLEYPSLIYDGPFSDGRTQRQPRSLTGPVITQDEAVALARAFYGEDRVRDARASGSAGGMLPSYGVELVTHDGDSVLAQVTQVGGRVHWLMRDPFAYQQVLSVEECMDYGRLFLEDRGYGMLQSTYAQIYNGLCTVNYAAVDADGVLLYPDLIKAQVSMQDGSVVGVEASSWLMNHHDRNLPEPLITAEDARLLADGNLEIDRIQLCLIPTEGDGELLAWECAGYRGGERYLVYIDALGGTERRILKVIDVEGGQLTI